MAGPGFYPNAGRLKRSDLTSLGGNAGPLASEWLFGRAAASVGRSLELGLDSRAAIETTLGSAHDVRTSCGRELAFVLRVNVQEQALSVGGGLALGWDGRARLGAQLPLPLGVRERASADLGLAQDVRRVVSSEVVLVSDLREGARRDLALALDVRRVTRGEVQIRLGVRGRVVGEIALIQDALRSVGKSLAATLDARGAVGIELALPFALQASGIGLSLVLPFVTRVSASCANELRLDARAAVGEALALASDVRTAAGTASVLVWSLASAASAELSLAHDLRAGRYASLALSYALHRAIGRGLAIVATTQTNVSALAGPGGAAAIVAASPVAVAMISLNGVGLGQERAESSEGGAGQVALPGGTAGGRPHLGR